MTLRWQIAHRIAGVGPDATLAVRAPTYGRILNATRTMSAGDYPSVDAFAVAVDRQEAAIGALLALWGTPWPRQKLAEAAA